MERLLRRILGMLEEQDFSGEKAILKSLNGKSVSETIKADNYEALGKSGEYKKIFFVDGGSAPLLSSSSFALGVFRSCIIKYENNDFSVSFSEDIFCAAIQEQDLFSLITSPEKASMNGVRIKPKSFEDGFGSSAPWRACANARRLLELLLAIKAASENKNSLIVLDGSLDGEEHEENLLKALKTVALKNNNVVIGLSKSNSFSTDMNRPLAYALFSRKKNSWVYRFGVSPSDKFIVCYAKLSKDSVFALRTDFFQEQENHVINALESLASNSDDVLFQGYPYGLVEADDFARITLEEKQSILAGLASGKDWDLLERAANNIHDLLDSAKF